MPARDRLELQAAEKVVEAGEKEERASDARGQTLRRSEALGIYDVWDIGQRKGASTLGKISLALRLLSPHSHAGRVYIPISVWKVALHLVQK